MTRERQPVTNREPRHELHQGDVISLYVTYLTPEGGIDEFELKDKIDEKHGGGFYGEVLTLQEDKHIVLKTAQPADSWHELWRLINWGTEFPPQVGGLAARHDHLTSRIISTLLPYVTNGKVTSPTSYGYTYIDGAGYVQVLERMKGRPPRFDAQSDEVATLQRAQKELLEIGTIFGLEHIGQIHPDNPFAFENLWVGEDGNIIWLDTLAAFQHTGFVAPFFKFDFHHDVRRRMRMQTPTFNRIHTDKFRNALAAYADKIPIEVRTRLEADLSLYDDILPYLWENGNVPTQFHIHDKELFARIATLLYESVREASLGEKLTEFANDNESRLDLTGNNIARYLFDPPYRNDIVMKQILKGVKTAQTNGLISEGELEEIEASVSTHPKILAYTELQAVYIVLSYIFNFLEQSTYAAGLALHKPEALPLGVIIGRVPSVLRPIVALAMEKRHDVDFHIAAKIISLLPLVGPYATVASDIALSSRGKNHEAVIRQEVWHYTLRTIMARISQLRPWGGMGSQLEIDVWNQVGPAFGQEQVGDKVDKSVRLI